MAGGGSEGSRGRASSKQGPSQPGRGPASHLPLTLLQAPGNQSSSPLPSSLLASADMGASAWNTLSHLSPETCSTCLALWSAFSCPAPHKPPLAGPRVRPPGSPSYAPPSLTRRCANSWRLTSLWPGTPPSDVPAASREPRLAWHRQRRQLPQEKVPSRTATVYSLTAITCCPVHCRLPEPRTQPTQSTPSAKYSRKE